MIIRELQGERSFYFIFEGEEPDEFKKTIKPLRQRNIGEEFPIYTF